MRLRSFPAIVLGCFGCCALWAQSTTVTNGITIKFQHGAWGVPQDVWAGLVPSDPQGVGSITVTAENGSIGTWDIQGMEFFGAGNVSRLFVSIFDGANNTLEFDSSDAQPVPDETGVQIGRTGTFTKFSGTGAFRNMTGNMTYTFLCDDPHPLQCNNSSGPPNPTNFQASFSADGTIAITFTLQPPPPAKPVPKTTTTTQGQATAANQTANFTPGGNIDIVPVGTGSNLLGGGSARPKHQDAAAAGSGGPDGSLAITIPSQFAASTYSASAACANLSTSCWLSLAPPTSGTLPIFTAGSILANLDFGSLANGVYPADVSVALAATDGSIPPSTQNYSANLIISANPLLPISETAVALQTTAGATGELLHPLALSSAGSLTYSATTSTLTGGSWLSVTPASGTVSPGADSSMAMIVNPSGLAAGQYFGRVDIQAPGALTEWQSVPVELTVLAPGPAIPMYSTTGLFFIAPQGSFPAVQDVLVSSFSNQSITVAPGTDDNELAWLAVDAASTTLQPGQTVKQSLLVGNKTLTPGVYPGSVLEAVGTNTYPITAVYIVTPSSGTCTPTQLIPVFTNLYAGFEFPAGLPISIQAKIMDDCGSSLNSGTVIANFGPGDAPVFMTAIGNGQWSAAWLPHGTTPGAAAVGISAQNAAGLQGTTSITGTIDANTTLPVVTPGGIVSAADPTSIAPLAPGQFISIYGSNLAPSVNSSTGSSYQTTLAGTQVLLGGVPLPLEFVSPGVINAVVPFETPVNGIQELLISQNGAYSLPETAVVAAASPAIFTQDESGQGAGVIVVIKANGTVYETSPTQPASAGDLLLIYAAGLGAVNPAVADGAPAPSAPPFATTVNPVTATIGGVPAQVQFAGLAPGYVGVYQLNVTVPAGITAGSDVPVVLTTSGFSSTPVTVTIQ